MAKTIRFLCVCGGGQGSGLQGQKSRNFGNALNTKVAGCLFFFWLGVGWGIWLGIKPRASYTKQHCTVISTQPPPLHWLKFLFALKRAICSSIVSACCSTFTTALGMEYSVLWGCPSALQAYNHLPLPPPSALQHLALDFPCPFLTPLPP